MNLQELSTFDLSALLLFDANTFQYAINLFQLNRFKVNNHQNDSLDKGPNTQPYTGPYSTIVSEEGFVLPFKGLPYIPEGLSAGGIPLFKRPHLQNVFQETLNHSEIIIIIALNTHQYSVFIGYIKEHFRISAQNFFSSETESLLGAHWVLGC